MRARTLSIALEFTIDAPRSRVVEALTTAEGVRGWWTAHCELDDRRGEFRWPEKGWTVAVRVAASSPALIVWKVERSNMRGTGAWEGTTIAFHLSERRDGRTALSFAQNGYKHSPCRADAADAWSYVLGLSLRSYVETGVGLAAAA